jgi:hypothetical protein
VAESGDGDLIIESSDGLLADVSGCRVVRRWMSQELRKVVRAVGDDVVWKLRRHEDPTSPVLEANQHLTLPITEHTVESCCVDIPHTFPGETALCPIT